MTPAALASAPPEPIRIRFRAPLATDEGYIVDSWRMGWRLAEANRTLDGTTYSYKFDALVRRGVLEQSDTRIIVGCAPGNVNEIWSWLCYTPGDVPTVHFAVTKKHVRSLHCSPRHLGFFTRLLAAAGIRSSLVYTFKPAERVHHARRDPLHAEQGLLAAARRAGINATYHSVEEFLAHRGMR